MGTNHSRGLQGLDGDATEPMVESLPDPMRDSADPEEEFQVAAAFLEPPVQGAHAQSRHQARRPPIWWQKWGPYELGPMLRL